MGKKIKITINDGENKVKLIIKNGKIHVKAIERNGVAVSSEELENDVLYKDNTSNKKEITATSEKVNQEVKKAPQNVKEAVQTINELNAKYNYYSDIKRKLMFALDEFAIGRVNYDEDTTTIKMKIKENVDFQVVFDTKNDTCKVVSNIMILTSQEMLKELGEYLINQLKTNVTYSVENGGLTLIFTINQLTRKDKKDVETMILHFAQILFNNKQYLSADKVSNIHWVQTEKADKENDITIEKYYSQLVDLLTTECFKKANARNIKWFTQTNQLCGELNVNVGFNIVASSQTDEIDAKVYTHLVGSTDDLFRIGSAITKNYDTKATLMTKQNEMNFCVHVINPFKNKMDMEEVVKDIVDVVVMVKENSQKFQVKDATEYMLKEALKSEDEERKETIEKPYIPPYRPRREDSLFPSAHGFVCYYGCPNSDKVLKLQTKKSKKKKKGERRE